MARRLRRGEVYWLQFRSPDKRRPVVILTHDEVLPKLTRITVAPITSTVRGVASEVLLNENDGLDGAVNLHNVMSVVPERLADRITQLSAARLREICRALNFALGCQAPGI